VIRGVEAHVTSNHPMFLPPSSLDYRTEPPVPAFYIEDALLYVQAVALIRAIFKRKKVFTTISLGLIYHYMAISQPPSRETVPLTFVFTGTLKKI
jgi:hypothetical protein